MKTCPKCDGKGYWVEYVPKNDTVEKHAYRCDVCHGAGEIVVDTNEDYIRTVGSTEELAAVLTEKFLDIISWNNDPRPSEVKRSITDWLKEKCNGRP